MFALATQVCVGGRLLTIVQLVAVGGAAVHAKTSGSKPLHPSIC